MAEGYVWTVWFVDKLTSLPTNLTYEYVYPMKNEKVSNESGFNLSEGFKGTIM